MTDSNITAQPTEQQNAPVAAPAAPAAVEPTGPGQVFQNVTHALSDAELTSPPVVKLILDRMRTAEQQRDDYREYMKLYYAKDKEAGILAEKLKTNMANEIMFGVGLTLGGALVGLVPFLWEQKDGNHLAGSICIGIAVVMIVGSILARLKSGSNS
jgi:VIT1/CCC1 family predicted Fe2+/Mn2+ transporter